MDQQKLKTACQTLSALIESGEFTVLATAAIAPVLRAAESLLAEIAALRAELAALRETNSKLNRRCQQADSAIADANRVIETITEGSKHGTPWVGGSFGRALLAHGCATKDRRIAELEAELAETPPTLEWMREILGPGEDRRGVVIWGELPWLVIYYVDAHRTEIHQTDEREWEVVWTRAAVLAAVAKQETGQ